ncbi:hypothetical protein HK096_008448 [Nowakowskiella sp. JEL0078]|nr:hypothetical protein HK096_008448 [Nowakowskiella sp. JEL0078]
MGLWLQPDFSYQDACSALIHKVAKAANMSSCISGKILDFAYGFGDQLLLIHKHYSIEKIVAVTLEKSQSAHAHNLVLKSNLSRSIFPFIGDAVNPDSWRSVADGSPFDETLENSFDVVVSVDACYHFYSRVAFLNLSFNSLKDGGTIGISDIILTDAALATSWEVRLFSYLTKIPLCNFMRQIEYEECFRKAGFDRIEIEDVSEIVFPGLKKFFKSHFDFLKSLGSDPSVGMFQYFCASNLVNWAYEKKLIKFVIVGAAKKSTSKIAQKK